MEKEVKSIESSAAAFDGIARKVFRLTLPFTLSPLTYIINFTFSNGCFSSRWKRGKVMPIGKKPNVESLNDYVCITYPVESD